MQSTSIRMLNTIQSSCKGFPCCVILKLQGLSLAKVAVPHMQQPNVNHDATKDFILSSQLAC